MPLTLDPQVVTSVADAASLLDLSSGATLAIVEGAAAVAGVTTYFVVRHIQGVRLRTDLSILQAATWHTVRMMENYPRKSSSSRGASRREVVTQFAEMAAEKGRPLPMGGDGALHLDVTNAAFELIDRNEKDGTGHWRHINAVRRGCTALLALYWLKNPQLAQSELIEHIKVQRLHPEGSFTNLTELKTLFSMPTEWPVPNKPLRFPALTIVRSQQIMKAVNKGFHRAAYKLVYKPWPEGKVDPTDNTFEGEAILEQLRYYTR